MTRPAGTVVPITTPAAPPSPDAAALIRVCQVAHELMNRQPMRYVQRHDLDRSDILPWAEFVHLPIRTSIYGQPL